MATARPKEKSAVGKEKALPSNSQSTKRTTKPYTPSGKPTSSSEKEKQIPNYLKATVSSHVESHSPQKTAVNRRRSLDKPPSSSTLTKHNQSSSRLHKALVSPGPRERSASQLRSLSSASEKTSRTSRDGKLSTNTKSITISRKNPNPTPKKVANDGGPTTAYSTKAPKSGAETKEGFKNVETEAEVKHAANEKVEQVVMKDDNKQEENENATNQINPPVVDTEHELEHKKEHEQDQVVEECKPGEPQTQADNNNVIPTASEEEQQQEEEEAAKAVIEPEEIRQLVEVEEKKEDPPEEKAEDVLQEGENKIPEEITDHSEPEEQKVDVEEKEEENHNGVTEEMEKENNKEEKAKEEKEVVEGETDEGVKKGEDDDHNVEKKEVKEEKAELKPKQGAGVHGKKETTQVSNDVIEETASKLEKRTNKVRALAGAFQTVIDHQSK